MTRFQALVAAAVGAGALYVVGAVALGSPPAADDSASEVVAWFKGHTDGARIYAWTATFGALAFAVFAGIVRGLLPAPHRDVFILGAAAFIVETSAQAWFWGALALHPGSLTGDVGRALLDVASYWGPVLTGATMAMIGAVTALGFGRTPRIPRWFALLGALAFTEQAIETITVFGTHGFIAPGGDMNIVLGGILTAAWLLGLAVWAARRLGAGEAGAQAA